MKKITSKTYLKWFEDMFFWRKFEDKCRSLYLIQKIRGFLHLYNGQEAIPAGIVYAMDKNQDNMITAYRCHIVSIAMGVNPKKVMAELLGKVTGTSKGMGGSMHIFSKKHRFYGGHGIVGGQIPLGAGIAFADKYFNRKSVTIILLGDGAINQGSLHETFNMAMLWKLPIIFICENNQYAMGTSIKRSTNINNLSKIGLSYDMMSIDVKDGMNPVKIAKISNIMIQRARNGYGPSFLNIHTYRYRGHSMSDSELYRSKKEIKKYKKKDPILKMKNLILKKKFSSLEILNKIEKKINKKIKKCVFFSKKSDFPLKKQIFDYSYKE
jgi:pyruvate dehydrogenase E1 component alpha subunit